MKCGLMTGLPQRIACADLDARKSHSPAGIYICLFYYKFESYKDQ